MFKSGRMAAKRNRATRQIAARGSCKRRKLEGNSNITSNRVTIPPGFLCLGVKSETVRRSPHKGNSDSYSNRILTEDLHGLFKTNPSENTGKLRRSSRVSKKPADSQVYETLSASEYFCRSLNTRKRKRQVEDEPKEGPHAPKTITRNNSKSLFREINERCARESIELNLGPNCLESRFRPSSFCLKLSREVRVDLDQHDYLFNLKLSIRDGILRVNARLRGEMNSPKAAFPTSDKMETYNNPMGANDFQYIPQKDWIFQTPPRQRVVFPVAEESAIQPAVICTTKKQSNIYELNPTVCIDLTGYTNRQNVPVDGRYLRHLATFEEKMEVSFSVENLRVASQGCQPDAACDFYESRGNLEKFGFGDVPSYHLAQATLRPIKTVKKLSRVNNLYSRRSEEESEDTPTGSVNVSRSSEDSEVTIVETNGKYRIVDRSLSSSEVPFDFKFRRNLFKNNDEKLFDFEMAEPSQFDFQIKLD